METHKHQTNELSSSIFFDKLVIDEAERLCELLRNK